MKTILVPTDFSEEAARAYPLAANLALKFDAKIRLLHIVRSHMDELSRRWGGSFMLYDLPTDYDGKDKIDVGNASAELDTIAALPVFSDVRLETAVTVAHEEDPAQAIIEELNKNEYGLIVMGTAGNEKDGESYAEIVARHTVTPLISTKVDTANYELKKILLATDLEIVTRGFIARAGDIARKFGGELHLLYVNTPKSFKSSEDIQKEAFKIRKKLRLPAFEVHEIAAYTVTEGIQAFLEKGDYDMVGLATHGRTGIAHYFYGSNTEDVINEVQIPVYTYNLAEFIKKYHMYEEHSAAMTAGFAGV